MVVVVNLWASLVRMVSRRGAAARTGRPRDQQPRVFLGIVSRGSDPSPTPRRWRAE